MKPGKVSDAYKTAFFLSVAIHIFFVTGAEAALILSKRLNPEPVFNLMINSSEIASSQLFTIMNRNEQQKTQSLQESIATEAIPNLRPGLRKVISGSKIKKPVFAKKVKKFGKHQHLLNQRITMVKKQIIQKQIESLQSVGSSVYDVEKIPLDIRESILPDYLKQMRFQILSQWLVRLESIQCKSCTSIVEYKITPRGKIFDLELLSSSQDQHFDSACLEAVNKSSPLPPLPFNFGREIKEDYLTISLTFYLEKKKPKLPKDLI